MSARARPHARTYPHTSSLKCATAATRAPRPALGLYEDFCVPAVTSLSRSQLFSALARSLDWNKLGGYFDDDRDFMTDMSGILKLAEALPHSQLTSLRWPTHPLNFAWTLCLCLPLRQQPLTLYLHCLGSLANNSLCGMYTNEYRMVLGTYTAEGINALCDALKGNSTLTSLNLALNYLIAEGCKAVAAVLDKTQITSLKCASPTPPSA